MQVIKKMKQRMKEEGLVLKAEEVTGMAKNDKRTKTKVLRLCDMCEDSDNAHLIFSVFRARMSDGITHGRHLSVIKTIWLMDCMARYGHVHMVEFIASAIPYIEDVAAFYGKHSEIMDAEAFEPVFQKACSMADYLRDGLGWLKNKNEEREVTVTIEDAVENYLVEIEDVLAEVNTRLLKKLQRGGNSMNSELVSPTPSYAGSTPANSFSTLLK